MKKMLGFCGLFYCLYSQLVLSENISEKLLVVIIDKKLPSVLYQHRDQPWAMGVYSLLINKLGKVDFTSTDTELNISIPIEAIVNGNIKQAILGTLMTINCSSKIITRVRIDIIPQLSADGSRADVSVLIPVPDADLNCDGLKVPARPILEQLISEHKQNWEHNLETDINNLFKQLDI